MGTINEQIQQIIDSRPLKSLIRRDVPNPKRLGKLFNHVQKEPHGPFEVVCCCR